MVNMTTVSPRNCICVYLCVFVRVVPARRNVQIVYRSRTICTETDARLQTQQLTLLEIKILNNTVHSGDVTTREHTIFSDGSCLNGRKNSFSGG